MGDESKRLICWFAGLLHICFQQQIFSCRAVAAFSLWGIEHSYWDVQQILDEIPWFCAAGGFCWKNSWDLLSQGLFGCPLLCRVPCPILMGQLLPSASFFLGSSPVFSLVCGRISRSFLVQLKAELVILSFPLKVGNSWTSWNISCSSWGWAHPSSISVGRRWDRIILHLVLLRIQERTSSGVLSTSAWI